MPKTAVAIALAGFVLAAVGSTSATAMQVVPLSKCVASTLSGDFIDVGWRGAGATAGAGGAAAGAGAIAWPRWLPVNPTHSEGGQRRAVIVRPLDADGRQV